MTITPEQRAFLWGTIHERQLREIEDACDDDDVVQTVATTVLAGIVANVTELAIEHATLRAQLAAVEAERDGRKTSDDCYHLLQTAWADMNESYTAAKTDARKQRQRAEAAERERDAARLELNTFITAAVEQANDVIAKYGPGYSVITERDTAQAALAETQRELGEMRFTLAAMLIQHQRQFRIERHAIVGVDTRDRVERWEDPATGAIMLRLTPASATEEKP